MTTADLAVLYRESQFVMRKYPAPRKRSAIGRHAAYYVMLTAVPLFCAAVILWQFSDQEWTGNLPWALSGAWMSGLLWRPILSRLLMRHYIRSLADQPGVLGDHRVRIDAEGVSDRHPYLEYKFFWPSVFMVTTSEGHVFFLTDYGHMVYVPKSAFDGTETWQAFLEAARTLDRRSHWPPPPDDTLVAGH